MEEVGSDYGVVEWTIENFSCWKEFHNEVITSLNFFGDYHFKIYPSQMSVQMLGEFRTNVLGDLSLIASDKYLFCSTEVDVDNQRSEFVLPSAPRFLDIVARIKMNEGLYKDQITVRFQMRGAVSNNVLYMRTVICVHEFSLRISGESMYNIFLYDLPAQCIRTIEYPSDESTTTTIYLYALYDSNFRTIFFNIKAAGSGKIAFIHSRMSVIDKYGTVVRSEVKESLYKYNEYETVSNSLTRNEVKVKGAHILLHLRIIPENKSEPLCTYNTTHQGPILPTDGLSLFTPNTCVENPSENIKADTYNPPENSLNVLSKDLMCLYQDQDLSDFQLKCDNVTFPVHKVILSARSPVFKTMISTDMKEATSGIVDLGDLDPSTLGLFLTYLYTGTVEDLQCDRALKLYYVADKYQVPSLKSECTDFLRANVSILNVCDILSLADKHRDDQLTSVAHDFILKKYNEVLSSDEWTSLVKSDCLLVAKTVTHFAQKKYVGNINTA